MCSRHPTSSNLLSSTAVGWEMTVVTGMIFKAELHKGPAASLTLVLVRT